MLLKGLLDRSARFALSLEPFSTWSHVACLLGGKSGPFREVVLEVPVQLQDNLLINPPAELQLMISNQLERDSDELHLDTSRADVRSLQSPRSM